MRKLYFVLLLMLVLLSACNDKLLEPKNIAVESPETAPLFQRELYVDASGSFSPGYRSRIIRPESVDLQWAKSNDVNFAYYQLYRGNVKIAKISDRDTINYLDEGLREDRHYKYSVITVLKNRFSKSDTLTIKTPSLAPPEVSYRISHEGHVMLSWIDRCEVPGYFEIFRSGAYIGRVEEYLGKSGDHIYSFTDSASQMNDYYNYRVSKVTLENVPVDTYEGIRVVYTLDSPILYELEFASEDKDVRLTWRDRSTGNTGYRVYRQKEGDDEFTIIHTINDPFEEEYIDTSDLSVRNTYHYYVVGIDSGQAPIAESPPSDIQSIDIWGVETWRLALKDSFGDGWRGNWISLRVNEVPVFVRIALEDGYGLEYHDFEVENGDVVKVTYHHQADFANENYYAILDHYDNIVVESGGTWAQPGISVPESIEFTVDFSSRTAQATAPQRSSK